MPKIVSGELLTLNLDSSWSVINWSLFI